MSRAKELGEILAIATFSAATISLNWTQINGALTAALILSNILFVWWRMRRKKKSPPPPPPPPPD